VEKKKIAGMFGLSPGKEGVAAPIDCGKKDLAGLSLRKKGSPNLRKKEKKGECRVAISYLAGWLGECRSRH